MTGESYQKPSENEFKRLKAHVAYRPPLIEDPDGSDVVIYGVYDKDGELRGTDLRSSNDPPEYPGIKVEVRSLTDFVEEFERRWEMAVSNRQ